MIYLCSDANRPGDLAKTLGFTGGISVVMINIKLEEAGHDITQKEVREKLMVLATRPDCLFAACSPPLSSSAKTNEIVDAYISVLESAIGHNAGF